MQNCSECHHAKSFQQCYQGALKLLPVSECHWVNIFMNFMKGLSLSLNKNSALCIIIIVIVNCLSKQTYVIPWFKTAVKDTAMIFYYQIFSHHYLFFTIILDWGTQFVSYFWQALCEILGIKTQLFTAFHPQTDR